MVLVAVVISTVVLVEYMVYFIDNTTNKQYYYTNKRLIKMEEGKISEEEKDSDDKILLKALHNQFNDDIHNINQTLTSVKTHVLNSFRYRRRNALELLAEELN